MSKPVGNRIHPSLWFGGSAAFLGIASVVSLRLAGEAVPTFVWCLGLGLTILGAFTAWRGK